MGCLGRGIRGSGTAGMCARRQRSGAGIRVQVVGVVVEVVFDLDLHLDVALIEAHPEQEDLPVFQIGPAGSDDARLLRETVFGAELQRGRLLVLPGPEAPLDECGAVESAQPTERHTRGRGAFAETEQPGLGCRLEGWWGALGNGD